MPLLLTESDVREVLSMRDLIDAMEAALVAFSAGRVNQPLRTVLEVGEQRAFFGVMPAYVPDSPALGTKLVTVFGRNAALGLPTHLATIVLLHPETGELLALIDGRFITEARTAAVSAVATKLLANPDAGTLALLGTGVQARSHLEAIACVRPLRDVRVWSPTASHRAAFVRDVEPPRGGRLLEARSAEEAVFGADLIVLATSSRDPVIRSAWVTAGAHVCAVGACRPDQREMEGALLGRARVFVDSRTAALAEAGDIVLAIAERAFLPDRIAGEIGEVAAGRVTGREHAAQVTVFKSLGMAVEDVAAAHLAYGRASAHGLGRGILLS
jgi:ornithine cyclodeaminase/alanine dehydrogenase-like protein (mu-crystallin family)